MKPFTMTRSSNPSLFRSPTCARQLEALAAVIDKQFLRTVVIGEIQIRPPIVVEVRSRGRERPARASHTQRIRDVLERSVAHVFEQQILAAVRREVPAFLHDVRGFQMPEIDVGAEVAGDVEIEEAVAVEVEPDRAVRIHPALEARLFGDVFEPAVAEVVQQLRIAPLIDEQVLVAVVVVVTPDRAHGYAFARTVQRSDTRLRRDIAERAVMLVYIQRIRRTEARRREVQIRPVVVVEIGDGYART